MNDDFDLSTLDGRTITAARIEGEHDERDCLTLCFSDGTSVEIRSQDAEQYSSWLVISEGT